MTSFLTHHMPTAQFLMDTFCSVVFLGSAVVVYAMLLA